MKNSYAKFFVSTCLLLCAGFLWANGSKENLEKPAERKEPIVRYNSVAEHPFFDDEPELNKIVLEIVKNIQNEFAAMYTATTSDDMISAPSARNFELLITYDKIERNANYIGFIISAYQYTGGVHGNTILVPINYDVNTKKMLTLEKAIQPASKDWLTKLSEEARKQLFAKLKTGVLESDEEWITKGSEPNIENFSIFKIEKDTLKIIFSEYQVAPYSSGRPEIIIPLNFF